MPTLRELCSDIQSQLKLNNIDDRYSYRLLASRIKDKIRNFLKQDSANRTILKLADIWTVFPNPIELEEVNYIEFDIDIPDIRILKKSRTKIPHTFATNYGNLLRIFSVSGDLEYKIIKKIDLRDILNLEFRNKKIKYAWLENDYLFIPDSDVELVKGIGIPENPEELDNNPCKRPLDTVLNFPDYLLDIVKKDILNEIMRKPVEDNNPNLNSSQK